MRLKKAYLANAALSFASRMVVGFAAIVAAALAIAVAAQAQTNQPPDVAPGQIMGTVTDLRGDAVAGATVVLSGTSAADGRSLATPENGFFEFDDVKPGVPFQLVVSAIGFDDWKSPQITLQPGEVRVLGAVSLKLAAQNTTVTVTADSTVIATEQLKAEETQRVFGIIPNFYVSYEGANTAPLTPKMKFKLALRVSYDPVTVAGVALLSGVRQASDTPNYQQGLVGFGERFGSTAADGFTDIMIGGAILPSLLHQDPRYFYQGTGSTGSRLRHAMLSPFICRGDNGEWQPNYSSMGGDLASAAISNLYYPQSNRGAGLVFSSFAVGTAERVMASVAQEFIIAKLTHRAGKVQEDPAP